MDIYQKKQSPNVQYPKKNTLLPPQKTPCFTPGHFSFTRKTTNSIGCSGRRSSIYDSLIQFDQAWRVTNLFHLVGGFMNHISMGNPGWLMGILIYGLLYLAYLAGGFFTNPSETYAIVKIGNHLPPIFWG